MRRNIPPAAAPAGPIPATAGVGLRFPHHKAVLAGEARAAWLEVHPENYLGDGVVTGILDKVRRDHPVSLHATGLSLGSADGIDVDHLAAIAALADRIQPGLVSDHLSWSAAGGVHLPDLLPLPYTREALDVFARNIDRVQSALRRPILVENPSVYLAFAHSEMREGEFLAALARKSGCGLLLDINNVAVSAANLGEPPAERLQRMLDDLPALAIGEIHLAGHAVVETADGGLVHIDDHGSPVSDEVWRLYADTIHRVGPCPTLIEWDTAIPAFARLAAEAHTADAVMAQAQEVRHAAAG
jgi:uncharacterized protein (UPF0276 family)